MPSGIRTVTPADAPAVVDLAVASGLFAVEDAVIVRTMMSDYFAGKSDAGHLCLIDEQDEPLAVAYFEPAVATERTWYLTMIGVRSDRQGEGRGSALLARTEDILRDRRQRLLLVETSGSPAFERTRNFYVRCGYESEARVRDYYEPGDDMILFRKDLDSSPRSST